MPVLTCTTYVALATNNSAMLLIFYYNSYQSMDKATQKKFVEECKALNWDFIFNEDKANETIDNDLRLIEAINDEIRRREEMKANNSSEGLVEVDDATENKVNLAEILANLKIVASPTFIADAKRISGVEDALKFANDHKGMQLNFQKRKISCPRNIVMMKRIQSLYYCIYQ